ncbi:MAG: hypothetical protein WC548_02285 [Candidatus Pacearchaeota archaeon]
MNEPNQISARVYSLRYSDKLLEGCSTDATIRTGKDGVLEIFISDNCLECEKIVASQSQPPTSQPNSQIKPEYGGSSRDFTNLGRDKAVETTNDPSV